MEPGERLGGRPSNQRPQRHHQRRRRNRPQHPRHRGGITSHADRLRARPRPHHSPGSPGAQHGVLEAAGCEHIFFDLTRGAVASRPELADAPLAARPGDELVVTILDRLAASTRHLIELAGDRQTTGVHLVVLDQGIDTSTPAGHALFHTLEALAAFQHALMSESTSRVSKPPAPAAAPADRNPSSHPTKPAVFR